MSQEIGKYGSLWRQIRFSHLKLFPEVFPNFVILFYVCMPISVTVV